MISSVICVKYFKNLIWMLMGFWLTRRLSSENKSWRSQEDSVNDKKIYSRWNPDRFLSSEVTELKKYLRRENLQVVVTVHPQVAVHEGRQISYDSFIIYVFFCDNLNILLLDQFSNWEEKMSGSEWQQFFCSQHYF